MFAHPSLHLVLAALALAAVAPLASAQTLEKAVPMAGEPGDLVILRGTGLQGTTRVVFGAPMSGVVSWDTIGVAPLSVSPTEVLALVPSFLGAAMPIGSPGGSVSVEPAGLELPFYFLEATGGAVTTVGTGTTQASGLGKPVTSLGSDLAITGLWPWPPMPSGFFLLSLENATPGSLVVAIVGLPAVPPYLPIGDGQIVVNPSSFVVLGAGLLDQVDYAHLGLFVPATATGAFMFQWGLIEAGSGTLAVSNGMQVVLL